MGSLTIFAIFVGFIAWSGAYQSYENYKVFQITPKSQDQLNFFRKLQEQATEYGIFSKIDFWKAPSGVNRTIDLMLSPNDVSSFNRLLSLKGIQAKLVVQDVQKLINQQKAYVERSIRSPFKVGDAPNDFAIDKYHSVQEIQDWIDSLVKAYPSLASTFSIGQSVEKRELKVIKIGAAGDKKPGFFIDAGIHAREWITPSTAVYIINELVTKYDSNPTYKDILNKLDFYILPSLNPDGYEYSRSKDRQWRKNRSGPEKNCYGVDLNRNFGYHWGESGSSSAPCSETYKGTAAFSEPESTALSNYLLAHNDTLKAYITLHSYGDLYLYEYGYKTHTYPPDVDDLKNLATDSANAIKAVHGTAFEVGNSADILYEAAGASDDWSKGVANIKWVYTLELRPGPGDVEHDQFYGFNLPESYIIPVAEETWAGLQVIANKIIKG